MYISVMPELNTKSLQSSLIRSDYVKKEIISVNVYKTKTYVFIATVLTRSR